MPCRVSFLTLYYAIKHIAQGQERFQSLGVAFYRGADACILCYDITDAKSFNNINNWMNEFKLHVGSSGSDSDKFPFVVLGNKIDLIDKRTVQSATAQQWCAQHNNIVLYETSAKDATAVNDAFATVAKQALALQTERKPIFIPDTLTLNNDIKHQQRPGCCT